MVTVMSLVVDPIKGSGRTKRARASIFWSLQQHCMRCSTIFLKFVSAGLGLAVPQARLPFTGHGDMQAPPDEFLLSVLRQLRYSLAG